ncbi:MAG: chemotaxis protein CheW, partial [Pseudomonadota bacterium]
GERTVDTCIVIVDVELDGGMATIGCLVDSVKEVLEIADSEVEPPPRMGLRLNTDFIEGMGREQDRFIIILKMDRIVSTDEILQLQGAGGSSDFEKTVPMTKGGFPEETLSI